MNKVVYGIIIASIATIASAQSTQLKFTGMDLNNADIVTVSLNGQQDTVYAGALSFRGSNNLSFNSYCADLASTLNSHYHTYNESSTAPNPNTSLNLAGSIVADNFSSATTADQQAGLQLAVWSAIYDNGSSFEYNQGSFQLNSVSAGNEAQIKSFAQEYYSAGMNHPSSALYFNTEANGGQSQLTPEAVPAPSSLLFCAFGAAGLLIRRKRS